MKQTLRRTESLSAAILMICWVIFNVSLFAVTLIATAITASKTGYTDGLKSLVGTIGTRLLDWGVAILMSVIMFRKKKDLFAGVVFAAWGAYCLMSFLGSLGKDGVLVNQLALGLLMVLFAVDCFLKGKLAKYGWAFIVLSLVALALSPTTYIRIAKAMVAQTGELYTGDMTTILLSAWLPQILNIVIKMVLSLAYVFAAVSFAEEKTVQVVYADDSIQMVPVSATRDEGFFGMAAHVFLTLFAGAVWLAIWSYRSTKYLNKAPDEARCNPLVQMILFLIVPFYSIYWFYQQGKRMDKLANSCGIRTSDAMACLLLGLFLPIGAVLLIQSRINSISKACGTSAPHEYAQA